MFKKLLFLSAFAVAPLAMSENASADHCRGYGGGGSYHAYRAPVGHYGIPVYRSPYRSSYRASGFGYSAPYRSSYRGGYSAFGYPGFGYPGYYGRGTSIGIGRGGVSLNFGF